MISRLLSAKKWVAAGVTALVIAGGATAQAANPADTALVYTEVYIWNRLADFLEILRMGAAAGPAAGAELAFTEHAQIGAYAASEQGGTFPHFFPPLWIVPYLDEGPMFTGHEGEYRRWVAGPRSWESTLRKDVRFPRKEWEVRGQVALGLFHLYGSWDLYQTGDFLAGFVTIDPMEDDQRPSPIATREPARQLGRGVTNTLFGLLEIPKNLIRVTDEDGHFAGLTLGLVQGTWRGLVREGVGVLEIVTFPMGWEPIVEPEFVLEEDTVIDWRVNQPAFVE